MNTPVKPLCPTAPLVRSKSPAYIPQGSFLISSTLSFICSIPVKQGLLNVPPTHEVTPKSCPRVLPQGLCTCWSSALDSSMASSLIFHKS